MASIDVPQETGYTLSRGYRDSARLHLQHWMWNCSLGYLLHPCIPVSTPDLRVLDVGTGNGCWVLELARHCPTSWELEGSDVSAEQFPAEEYLPKNVRLKVLDAFQEIPGELHEAFDIVHIRAFALVVKGASTDNWLMGLEEFGNVATSRTVGPLGTRDAFDSIYADMVRETTRGVSIAMDMVVVVGRKAA
ncbi:MAG: hypothetical protein Q9188_005039 [Gyalolechia gomerana]